MSQIIVWGADVISDIKIIKFEFLFCQLNHSSFPGICHNWRESSGPHPCPSASGMLRDPEFRDFFRLNACGRGDWNIKKQIERVFFHVRSVF